MLFCDRWLCMTKPSFSLLTQQAAQVNWCLLTRTITLQLYYGHFSEWEQGYRKAWLHQHQSAKATRETQYNTSLVPRPPSLFCSPVSFSIIHGRSGSVSVGTRLVQHHAKQRPWPPTSQLAPYDHLLQTVNIWHIPLASINCQKDYYTLHWKHKV